MKYILGAICGFLILNLITLIIMIGATFITWENCFFYMNEWTYNERASYFMFGLGLVFGGCCTAINYKGVNK